MSYTVILIVIMIIALLLILIIMVQNPKGGGLSSSFGGGPQSIGGGVQSTNDFLDKSTWTLAIMLMGLILLLNFVPGPNDKSSSNNSQIENTINDREIQDVVPTTTPENNTDTKKEDAK